MARTIGIEVAGQRQAGARTRIGAIALDTLGHLTRNLFENAAGLSLVVYGVVLVLMVTFAPRGLVGLFQGRGLFKSGK